MFKNGMRMYALPCTYTLVYTAYVCAIESTRRDAIPEKNEPGDPMSCWLISPQPPKCQSRTQMHVLGFWAVLEAP